MSMKFKTKKKDIMANYCYVIETGYCTLQNLLQYRNPIAYTAGIYGWGCDIYEVAQNTVITTGYSPFGNVEPDYKLIREYDQKAEKYIAKNRLGNLDKKSKYLDKLIKELVDKIISKYKEKEQ